MPIVGGFVFPHPPIIFPEIGRGEQRKIQKTIDAYREATEKIVVMQPETIVILSPHATMYRDYFHISPGHRAQGSFAQFGFPELIVEAEYDTMLADEIERQAGYYEIPAGKDGEQNSELDHGTMVPLRFIKEAYQKKFKIIRIGLAGLPLSEHYKLGKCIKSAVENSDKRVAIVASGDLSHKLLDSGPYEYAEEGPEYDKRITEVLASGNLDKSISFSENFCMQAGECGHRSIAVLAGCLEDTSLKAELLSYEGPFGVGYAVAVFRDAYVALARQSLEYCLRYGSNLPVPEGLPKEMLEKQAGAFVSLEKQNQLRGCIGTIQGVQDCIAQEIIQNAVSAGLWDPRFRQVEAEELKDIICTVDVLSEAEPVTSITQLDVKRYGVIVTKGNKRGLLLPNLDGVNTIEEQISIALQKAGIESDDYQLERFEVVRHY